MRKFYLSDFYVYANPVKGEIMSDYLDNVRVIMKID